MTIFQLMKQPFGPESYPIEITFDSPKNHPHSLPPPLCRRAFAPPLFPPVTHPESDEG